MLASTKRVFVIRADASDSATSSDMAKISDEVFGTGNDPMNLKSQYAACSYGKLNFEPSNGVFNGNTITGGVGEITLNSNVNGISHSEVRTNMLSAADAKYGSIQSKINSGEIHHVMLCIPPGTSGSWVAYAYINHWLSVYNDEWCNRPSGQMHEIGHNLGLAHSGESATYDDQSGMMGYSYSSDDGPVMCFNSPKSWQLGWYQDGQESISPLATSKNSFIGRLIGLAEYDLLDTASSDKVIIQITGYGSDYYVAFNRKVGINSGTVEGGNQVLVHSRAPGNGYETSSLLAKLSTGGTYTIPGNEVTTITVNSINTSANPGYAEVTIVGPNTDAPVAPPTMPPTIAPVTPPTTAPISPPTAGPTWNEPTTPFPTQVVPTMHPTHTPPTLYPTHIAPTPFPTDVPPTPYPTGATCAIKKEFCENHNDCCKKKCNMKKKFCRK